jgi:ABC-type dipeptide/oligopeptide/nickel transport system permease subunit
MSRVESLIRFFRNHSVTAGELPAVIASERRLTGRPYELFSAMRSAARELWFDKMGLCGVLFILALGGMAILAPWISPYDPAAQSLNDRLSPPFWLEGGSPAYWLGTDHLGRDVLSRTIFGSRVSLLVGLAVLAVAGSIGTLLGLIAGYLGGRTESLIMRWVDIQVAFPALLLALIILAVVRPSPLTLIIVLSLNGWMVYTRLVRGIVLSVKESPYVEAARIIGCRTRRIISRHILPNLTAPLLTLAVLEFARIVLAEAALSFLGLGIQPPATSWGLDVANGKNYIFNAWWLVTVPGAAIALTVLGMNLLASWLRVAADPREREKRFAQAAQQTGGTV